MKHQSKHESSEPQEMAIKFSIAQINHSLPNHLHASFLESSKKISDKIILITQKDLLSFAEAQKLFVNVENLTEKQRNDKSLANLPKSANKQVMAEAFKRFVNSVLEQKNQEKLIQIKQMNDAKAKEKLNKNKNQNNANPQSDNPDQLSANEKPVLDFVLVVDGYPVDAIDYLKISELKNSPSYLVNVKSNLYVLNEQFRTEIGNAELKIDQSLIEKQQIILKESFDYSINKAKQFENGVKISAQKSSFKQAIQIFSNLELIENDNFFIQVQKFWNGVISKIKEMESKRNDFTGFSERISIKPIKLQGSLNKDDKEKIIQFYNQEFDLLKNSIKQKNQAGFEIFSIIKSISKALDKHFLLENDFEQNQNFAFEIGACQESKMACQKSFVYSNNNSFGLFFDKSTTQNKSILNFDRKEIASYIPFFDTTEIEIANKFALERLESVIRGNESNWDSFDLFSMNYLEFLPASILSPRYFNYKQSFLSEEVFQSKLNDLSYHCLYNKIDSFYHSNKDWKLKNCFLPNFAFWNEHYQNLEEVDAASRNSVCVYDIDASKFGQIKKQTNQIYFDESCFMNFCTMTIKNNPVTDLNIFMEDSEIKFRSAFKKMADYNYFENKVPFAEGLFPALPTEQMESTSKKTKGQNAEAKVTPIYPNFSLESNYFRKPSSAEIIYKTNSSFAFISEIEAFFDSRKIFSTEKDFYFDFVGQIFQHQDKCDFGLSLTLLCNDTFAKVLPTGDVFVQSNSNEDKLLGTIITHKGHVIKYFTSKTDQMQSFIPSYRLSDQIEVLHPSGNLSQFKDNCWTVSSNYGKRFLYKKDEFNN